MTFLEYNCRRNTIELLKEFKMSLKDENVLYENSLNILNEGIWDSTKNILGKVGKFARKAIDIPENITAGIYKAFKVMKSVAFLAALVYLGFRFDAIRALFPWLAPTIDKMGSMVLNAGKDFLYGAFVWLKTIAKDVVAWLTTTAYEAIMGKGPGAPAPVTPPARWDGLVPQGWRTVTGQEGA